MKITDARFDELTNKARTTAIQSPDGSFSMVYAETLRHLVENEHSENGANLTAAGAEQNAYSLMSAVNGVEGYMLLKQQDPEFLQELMQIFNVRIAPSETPSP